MPRPKRYFHCSQEIVADPEIWELVREFGDRSLFTWLQILIYLDRTENQWRLTGDWLAVLSRSVRQSSANLQRQISWMTAKGWLQVGESSADGSPLLLKASNWLKYNKSPEHKKQITDSSKGSNGVPLLSYHNHSVPNHTIKNKSMPLRASVVDEEFWSDLGANPAYQHINLTVENGKMDAWLALPKNKHRKKTRQFALNWLNKIEKPLITQPAPTNGPYHKKVCL